MEKKTYLKLVIGTGLVALWFIAALLAVFGIVDKNVYFIMNGAALFVIGGLIQTISMEIIK